MNLGNQYVSKDYPLFNRNLSEYTMLDTMLSINAIIAVFEKSDLFLLEL